MSTYQALGVEGHGSSNSSRLGGGNARGRIHAKYTTPSLASFHPQLTPSALRGVQIRRFSTSSVHDSIVMTVSPKEACYVVVRERRNRHRGYHCHCQESLPFSSGLGGGEFRDTQSVFILRRRESKIQIPEA